MSAKSLQKHFSIHEESERRAYSKWINKILHDDKECSTYLPLDPYTEDIYLKIKDGVILCKLLNISISEAIDYRSINIIEEEKNNDFSKSMDNLCLVVNAARCRGANMGNVDLNEIYGGNKFAILDLIWQIIRIGFFNLINIHHHPEIIALKKTNESVDDLKEQSSSDIVLRYVNIHLKKSGLRHFINDYDDDFRDCLLYGHLIYRVAPVNLRIKMIDPATIANEKCVESRARFVIENLTVLNAESFLTEDDIINGFKRRNSACKLHMSTMMYLFEYYNGDLNNFIPPHRTKAYGFAGECETELTCRNFLNSFDVYPFSNHLLPHCRNGWILSEMFEILKPGCTSGLRFILDFDMDRYFPQRVHNTAKVVKLCQSLSLNCIDLEGEKIAEGDKVSIVNLIVEMMRYYFCKDGFRPKEILEWVNCQMRKINNKIVLHSFLDNAIVDENIFAMVLEIKTPGLLNKNYLGKNKLKNHKYAISIAHKAGIPIYTLPEHFIEGNDIFIALAFATLLSY